LKRSSLKNNKITEELSEINREISKVDDELKVAIEHREFILDLSKLLNVAGKNRKKQKRDDKISESDTDFFITKQEEVSQAPSQDI